jgi:hypothetical protein
MRVSPLLVLSCFALLAVAAFAPSPAQADPRVRIYLGVGDVLFQSGRPYYRRDHSPVYVAYDEWGRRHYYRYAGPPPGYAYGRPRYYVPGPVYYRPALRPVYRDTRWHPRRDDGWDDRRFRDDRYDHRDHDRYARRDRRERG